VAWAVTVIAPTVTGGPPQRAPRPRNFDAVQNLVAERVAKSAGRISARRLLPIARAAGYDGSARNFRRLVAEQKTLWRNDNHRGRRPPVWPARQGGFQGPRFSCREHAPRRTAPSTACSAHGAIRVPLPCSDTGERSRQAMAFSLVPGTYPEHTSINCSRLGEIAPPTQSGTAVHRPIEPQITRFGGAFPAAVVSRVRWTTTRLTPAGCGSAGRSQLGLEVCYRGLSITGLDEHRLRHDAAGVVAGVWGPTARRSAA